MAAKPEDKSTDIPDRLFDSNHRKTYKRMRFFGKVSAKRVLQTDFIYVEIEGNHAVPILHIGNCIVCPGHFVPVAFAICSYVCTHVCVQVCAVTNTHMYKSTNTN